MSGSTAEQKRTKLPDLSLFSKNNAGSQRVNGKREIIAVGISSIQRRVTIFAFLLA